ncbi:MAG TPA: hypothetical protein VGE07_26090 [Herpetosiphonaceae bacterium]
MPNVQCPNCRNTVDSAQTFCPECGTRITASLPPSATEPTQMLPRPGDPPSYGGQYGQPPAGAPGAPTYPPPGQYGQPGAPTYPPPGQYGQQPSGQYGQPGSYPPPGQYGQQPGGYGGYPQPGGSAPKSKTPLIVGGIVGVLALGGIGYAVSQGGGGGNSTPTTSSRATTKPTTAATRPKPTTKPTEEPTEEPTPATGFGSLPGSTVILDDFSDKRERWPETDPFVGDAYRYTDDAYQIQVDSSGRILWTGTNEAYTDIHARVDVSFINGPDTNAAGLTLREQDAGGMYVFQLSPSGSYAFRRRDPGATSDDGEWTNVVDWTESGAIKTGMNEVNQIEILAVGSSFTLTINGQEVDVAVDDTYTSGAVGFGASSFDEGGTLAQFDNLEINEP